MPTPNLNLPYIVAAQSQKEVTHGQALDKLDALVQLSVIDRDLLVPPATPTLGDRYLVPAAATGAWAGLDGQIVFYAGVWVALPPAAGWHCWVADEAILCRYDGAAWVNTALAPIAGWDAATGTATRTTFDTATATVADLAERLKALIDDLKTAGTLE